jgi:hypothetical protein
MGRALDGVAMDPLMSDSREIERRDEFTSPCADAGRLGEPDEPEVDRDTDGPMGSRTETVLLLLFQCPEKKEKKTGKENTPSTR